MRKLASIEHIWQIDPIKDADKIETVHVLGWTCVAEKGDFKKGDLAVYFEIDSFLPVNEHFEFLRTKSYKKNDIMGEGMLLKTMKFRGQYSQGLVMPLSEFPEIDTNGKSEDELVGMDVTDILGVRKWEIEERTTGSGTIVAERPAFIPKTDETRIQSEPDLLKEFAGKPYYITTKMDGSSHSIGIDEDGKVYVCGHNYEYADDGKSGFYEYLKKNDIIYRLRCYKENKVYNTIVLQGEFCAPGIQANPIGLVRPHWFVFTVIVNGKRLGLSGMRKVVKALDVEMVPVVEEGEEFPYISAETLLTKADGMYEHYDGMKTDHAREGLVIRPKEPVYSNILGTNLSMKVVSNRYLAKKAKKE